MHDFDTLDANVLIIGGGFAGIWAALRAAEITDNVVLLDKAYVSRSGSSTMSGGVTTCPQDGDDIGKWAAEFVSHGSYMCDQRWTWRLLEGQRERVRQLAAWGTPISRDADGNIRRFASRGMIDVRCMQYSPKKAMEALRREATARGVRVIDRVCVTELMTSDGEAPTGGEVAGAFGFNAHTGRCLAVHAKQTILATGAMSMKGTHGIDNVCCDGPAMSYRAGARLVDLEFSFGGTFSHLMREFNFGSYNVAIAHGARLINARGERFMEQYDPVRIERGELNRVVAAFVKEMIDGRGPVYVDLRHCDDRYWEDIAALSAGRGANILLSNKVPNPKSTPLAIEPTWGLWNGGRGGVSIDYDCRTTLPRLLSAGIGSKNLATGTHASAGVPTAWSMNTGWFAGETAARDSLCVDFPALPRSLAARMAETTMAPLSRAPGALTPGAIHDGLSALEASVVETMRLDGAKLGRMSARARELGDECRRAFAENTHELVKLNEAANIAQTAEAIYLSALDRTESREQFYREDCPDTDDENWFCWHGLTLTPEGPRFDRAEIPADGPLKRPSPRPKHPSPIAAIMTGTWREGVYS